MPQFAISPNLTLTLSPEQWQGIESALFAGRKIEAIRMLREVLPQAGLADAKSYIEWIERDLRAKQPALFTNKSDSSPWLGRLIFILLLLGVVGYAVFKL